MEVVVPWLWPGIEQELRQELGWNEGGPSREKLQLHSEDDTSNFRVQSKLLGQCVQILRFENNDEPINVTLSDRMTSIRAIISANVIKKYYEEERKHFREDTTGGVIQLLKFEIVATHYGRGDRCVMLRIEELKLVNLGGSGQFGHPEPIEKRAEIQKLIGEMRAYRQRESAKHATGQSSDASAVDSCSEGSRSGSIDSLNAETQSEFATQFPTLPLTIRSTGDNDVSLAGHAFQAASQRSSRGVDDKDIIDGKKIPKVHRSHRPDHMLAPRHNTSIQKRRRQSIEELEKSQSPKPQSTLEASAAIFGQGASVSTNLERTHSHHPPTTEKSKAAPALPGQQSKNQIYETNPWKGVSRIRRRDVTISKSQAALLDRSDSFLPAKPGEREPVANIPLPILEAYTAIVEHPAKTAAQPGKTIGTNDSEHSSGENEQSDDSEAAIDEWPPSPPRDQQFNGLPPDSPAESPVRLIPARTSNGGIEEKSPSASALGISELSKYHATPTRPQNSTVNIASEEHFIETSESPDASHTSFPSRPPNGQHSRPTHRSVPGTRLEHISNGKPSTIFRDFEASPQASSTSHSLSKMSLVDLPVRATPPSEDDDEFEDHAHMWSNRPGSNDKPSQKHEFGSVVLTSSDTEIEVSAPNPLHKPVSSPPSNRNVSNIHLSSSDSNLQVRGTHYGVSQLDGNRGYDPSNPDRMIIDEAVQHYGISQPVPSTGTSSQRAIIPATFESDQEISRGLNNIPPNLNSRNKGPVSYPAGFETTSDAREVRMDNMQTVTNNDEQKGLKRKSLSHTKPRKKLKFPTHIELSDVDPDAPGLMTQKRQMREEFDAQERHRHVGSSINPLLRTTKARSNGMAISPPIQTSSPKTAAGVDDENRSITSEEASNDPDEKMDDQDAPRLSPDSKSSSSLRILQPTVFERFKHTYQDYNGTEKHFIAMAGQINNLQVQGRMLHKSLWDDFVIRHQQEYRAYLHRCTDLAEDPVSYERFYHEEIDEPKYSKRILTPASLGEVLPDDTIRSVDKRQAIRIRRESSTSNMATISPFGQRRTQSSIPSPNPAAKQRGAGNLMEEVERPTPSRQKRIDAFQSSPQPPSLTKAAQRPTRETPQPSSASSPAAKAPRSIPWKSAGATTPAPTPTRTQSLPLAHLPSVRKPLANSARYDLVPTPIPTPPKPVARIEATGSATRKSLANPARYDLDPTPIPTPPKPAAGIKATGSATRTVTPIPKSLSVPKVSAVPKPNVEPDDFYADPDSPFKRFMRADRSIRPGRGNGFVNDGKGAVGPGEEYVVKEGVVIAATRKIDIYSWKS